MDSLGKRIIKLRKDKGFSQSYLAKQVGISYAQIGRYETKGAQPPAEVLKKIADALDTSVDYLINGNTDEKAASTLKDAELLKQFKEIDQMPENEKATIIKVVSAYIRDYRTRQAYA